MENFQASEFAELFQRAALGDVAAQESICQQYERHVRIVVGILLGPKLRPHLDTMDLVQSVHRSLLIGIKNDKFSVSSAEKLVSLACTIVRRKVARKWRVLRRQVQAARAPAGDPSYISEVLSSIANPHVGPAETAEFDDKLQQLCAQMNEIERIMVEMRLEGYTNAEIAERVQIHPVAIRARWTRLRQRFDAMGILSDWV
jgi:RNA polymerase sigma-70 factor (ECF subfamily)